MAADANMPQAARQEAPAQIVLSPIASPMILGLFGLATALFVFGTRFASWYGNLQDFKFIFPFLLFVGGLTQFLGGMWSYKARDGVGTALHGMWGAFWFGFAILWLVAATGRVAIPPSNHAFVPFGYWLLAMCAITWSIAMAAWAENGTLGLVSLFLAAGTTILAVGELIGNSPIIKIGGWCLILTSLLAWYAGTAVMVNQAYGYPRLPMLTTGGPQPGPADYGSTAAGTGTRQVSPTISQPATATVSTEYGATAASAAGTGSGQPSAAPAPAATSGRRGAVEGPGGRDCPAGYPIKGNASSMIYHQPGERYYSVTIPEMCFATEKDAVAAGYRPYKHAPES